MLRARVELFRRNIQVAEVAEAAGLDRTTVSNQLCGNKPLGDAVRAAVERLTGLSGKALFAEDRPK